MKRSPRVDAIAGRAVAPHARPDRLPEPVGCRRTETNAPPSLPTSHRDAPDRARLLSQKAVCPGVLPAKISLAAKVAAQAWARCTSPQLGAGSIPERFDST